MDYIFEINPRVHVSMMSLFISCRAIHATWCCELSSSNGGASWHRGICRFTPSTARTVPSSRKKYVRRLCIVSRGLIRWPFLIRLYHICGRVFPDSIRIPFIARQISLPQEWGLKLAILMWQSQSIWRDFRDYPPRDGFGGFRDTAILVAYSSYF